MKKTTIYTRSKDIAPTSYYRILQYTYKMSKDIQYYSVTPPKVYRWYHSLKKENPIWRLLVMTIHYLIMLCQTTIHLFSDAYIQHPEQIVIQRTVLPRYMPFFVAFLLKKATRKAMVIWDFDDDIFETKEISNREKKILVSRASKIIVINHQLKNLLPEEAHHKVVLMPTTDGDMQDENRVIVQQERAQSFEKEVKLVWVATPSNLCNLQYVLPQLDQVAKEIKKSGRNLRLIAINSIPTKYDANDLIIENRRWTRQVAIDSMKEAHIGIMPLICDKIALGKGGFKIVQYLSIALPVIASNVGFNKEVVDDSCGVLVDDIDSPENWYQTLLDLIQSEDLDVKGKSAYQRWANHFSYADNYKCWSSYLN